MNVGIRTPSEVIALAVEDAGLDPDRARAVAEDAARRLAMSLARVSRPRAVVVIRATTGATLEWATVRREEGGGE